ncbi:MAG: YbgA family protein, partial [Haemophilus seminalis]
MDQKHQCQVLWAKNKYLVLSHSSNLYKEIREYLKQDQVEVSHVEDLIQQALALPENRGQVSNAFQHIWGYFKMQATPEEKADFMPDVTTRDVAMNVPAISRARRIIVSSIARCPIVVHDADG